MTKYWLLISCGDSTSIGYELALRAVLLIKKNKFFLEPVLIGDYSFLNLVIKKYKINLSPIYVNSNILKQIKFFSLPPDKYLLVNISSQIKGHNKKYSPGEVAYYTLLKTVSVIKDIISSGKKVALLTMPVAKKYLQRFIPGFTGHTEFFQKNFLNSRHNISMLMEGKDNSGKFYRVLMLTRHLPLKNVSQSLKLNNVVKQVIDVVSFINRYEYDKVTQIFFCNINPHCGEDGLLGNEEKFIINKSIKILNSKLKNIKVIKIMFAADAFLNANRNTLIVSTYHDQTMIPLKILCGYKVVNVTVGLPFFRVSPGHGTAENIFLKNKADISGVKFCIEKINEFVKNDNT